MNDAVGSTPRQRGMREAHNLSLSFVRIYQRIPLTSSWKGQADLTSSKEEQVRIPQLPWQPFDLVFTWEIIVLSQVHRHLANQQPVICPLESPLTGERTPEHLFVIAALSTVPGEGQGYSSIKGKQRKRLHGSERPLHRKG